MCTTGKDAWCAREADNCPAEGSKEQPECIDDACEGKDEKCMTGENEECDCKKPQCPDLRKYSFWCSECGGKDSDGKCRGVSDFLIVFSRIDTNEISLIGS
ncbi:hypothetical protein EV356DRAFT_496718 [Viridothelium virens]|uniref:Uncharacterized protein n=1 Tax=Viridothelium virens TaxID=1048519 RepID=A0A6A6HH68_VIRVR|nr:hypothetical protein EV356DRAFT_496718 [Viridothelium virens]